MARTPWGRRRFDRRLKEDWRRLTGHEDWGDDRVGGLLEGLGLGHLASLEVRRLATVPPGVELGVTEVKAAWDRVDSPSGYVHDTLGLLEDFKRVGLVDIAESGDGRRWLTVPEELHERLRSRWSAEEEADWHGRLVHNAFVLLKPGDPWWALPAGATYWWRHLVWHLRYCDPDQANRLVLDPGWQVAKIQRCGVRGLLDDLALVDSPESRAAASVVEEVMGGEESGSRRDPRKLAEHHGVQPLSAVRAVLQLPPRTMDFAMSPDGAWLVAVGPEGNIHLYDMEAQALRRVIRTPADRVQYCAFAPDGSFLMTGVVGEKAQAWDPVSGEERLPFKVGTVDRSVYGPDGMWVAYNPFTGSFVYPLTNERRGTKPTSKDMYYLALAADGSVLAALGRSRQVLLWDPRSGRLLAELPDQPHAIYGIGLAGDGSWIALGDEYSIRILELPSHRERFAVKHRGTPFATTEEWLAVPVSDHVEIRSTGTGELLTTLEAHPDDVLGCHMSHDRRHLMTFARGGTLIVWDAAAVVSPARRTS